ncbi:MAG: TIM barrel protein [Aestuariivita sp.]|uniref:hydroxypyruvate isomerase family protein n=1 Tax=Aestuariivita sp. TaxID=1872407 RepID=UPI003BAF176B
MRFSANLGFLWSDLSLPDAIRAAKAAGFDAVECHWPYTVPPALINAALAETGLKLLGLNTSRGDVEAGENGLSALPGREADARAAIDQAVAYAIEVRAANIHVMAGFAAGAEAHQTFVENLRHACAAAAPHGITILIEPLNSYDAPGYFLQTTSQAVQILGEVDAPNLKLMFDCYHVQLMEGDLSHRLARLKPQIGHIQFASVPDRGAPDQGEVNYAHVFAVIDQMGYDQPLGAEYKPKGPTDDTLDWMQRLR